MRQTPDTPQTKPREHFAWAGRAFRGRATWVLVLSVFVVRLVYQVFFNPADLSSEEPQYWDWSRRPSLCYYTKGPGVAWAIAASTTVFGDGEWAVRLPSAVFSAITALALAGLARDLSGGDDRAGFFAAAAFCLLPFFTVISDFATTDPPLFMCYALSCWAGWRAYRAMTEGRGAAIPMAGLGLAVGVGVLFKFTCLLVVPGLLAFYIHKRRAIRRCRVGDVLLALAFFFVAIGPILIWNHQHSYPTLRHLLGYVHAPGGDAVSDSPRTFTLYWVLDYVLVLVGLSGVFGAVVMGYALLRGRSGGDAAGRAFVVWTSVSVLGFYLVVSFMRQVLANWPWAGVLPLLAWAGCVAVRELSEQRDRVAHWLAMPEPRPKEGFLRRKPESVFQVCWDWYVAVGCACGVLVLLLPVLFYLPGAMNIRLLERLNENARRAEQVQQLISPLREAHTDLLIVTDNYHMASAMAYYLPGKPIVASGAGWFGSRTSAYDFFEDTDLTRASMNGRPTVMIGGELELWQGLWPGKSICVLDAEARVYAIDHITPLSRYE
ncbi:MAG: phospholipid carrier-dependent glycosyltransferase [Phycisphaera sp.]|nr:phospholipid carrier-dependent glycosyltransferase [Phycisphaera sp.]